MCTIPKEAVLVDEAVHSLFDVGSGFPVEELLGPCGVSREAGYVKGAGSVFADGKGMVAGTLRDASNFSKGSRLAAG